MSLDTSTSLLYERSYLFVSIEDRCVISTLCIPNLEFQLVNPTTQVALFSECRGSCSSLMNISWNIYQSSNGSSATILWTPFSQITQHLNTWFFGRRLTYLLPIIPHRSSMQGETQLISPPPISCFLRILTFAIGASK